MTSCSCGRRGHNLRPPLLAQPGTTEPCGVPSQLAWPGQPKFWQPADTTELRKVPCLNGCSLSGTGQSLKRHKPPALQCVPIVLMMGSCPYHIILVCLFEADPFPSCPMD